jgi:HPr kinase/phosphorylase
MKLIHATCVLIDGCGLLLRGPSGSGKSDLALRLIGRGARLVGDDYVYVGAENGSLYAAAPHEIEGRIEVRGVGIMAVPYTTVCRVTAVIDLSGEKIERLPLPVTEILEGVALPAFRLDPFEAAACEKALMMLQYDKAVSARLQAG